MLLFLCVVVVVVHGCVWRLTKSRLLTFVPCDTLCDLGTSFASTQAVCHEHVRASEQHMSRAGAGSNGMPPIERMTGLCCVVCGFVLAAGSCLWCAVWVCVNTPQRSGCAVSARTICSSGTQEDKRTEGVCICKKVKRCLSHCCNPRKTERAPRENRADARQNFNAVFRLHMILS